MGAAGRNFPTEQLVHRFERDTLCLGHEEEDEDSGAEHEGGEEHVDAEAHGSEHLRSESVEEAVSR